MASKKSDAEMTVAELLKDLQQSTEDRHTKRERLLTYALEYWPNRGRGGPPTSAVPGTANVPGDAEDADRGSGTT